MARELTKVHEQIERGTLGALAAAAADGTIPARGEFVIVVGMGEAASSRSETGDGDLVAARAAVERLVAEGIARGEAARQVAADTGIPRRQLYGTGSDRTERT